MLIKKRPIITWLLDPDSNKLPDGILLARSADPINHQLLNHHLEELNNIRIQEPEWGLPELLMPSFEEVMKKSAPSFEKIMPQLFYEFSEKEECGILLCQGNVTMVYGYGGDKLHIWYFSEQNGKSIFNFYTSNDFVGDQLRVGVLNLIISDNALFQGSLEDRHIALASVVNFVSAYVAVKRFVKVETVIIPQGKFTAVEGTPLEYVDKKKIINQTGQEVIVMDSKWFRKIINDNDIYVRGFWRMQNKKNDEGEWYKELIFVDSFVRHGYHRNAKIEDETER